jgi:arylsulfatase A-like enzyme
MLADDWGWGDVGAYGANGPFALSGTNTRTPSLDALAANGTLFTDFHTGQAYCAPSRTSFMTGKFPMDLSVNTNWNTGPTGAGANHKAGLPYQLPTPSGAFPSPWENGLPNVPSTLQAAGYATACVHPSYLLQSG